MVAGGDQNAVHAERAGNREVVAERAVPVPDEMAVAGCVVACR